MPDPRDEGLRPPDEPRRFTSEAQPRAVGSPLPVGSNGLRFSAPLPSGAVQTLQPEAPRPEAARPEASRSEAPRPEASRPEAPPQPGRSLAERAPATPPGPTGMQRAVGAFRAALPFVQRLLPLLEGNVASAVSNMLAPQHHAPPPAPVQPPVNLAPLQEGLAQLQTLHRQLHDQVADQVTSFKRVEDQLDAVREATDRNTLEQQELLDDLKGVSRKVNLYALIVLGLLAVSVIVNVVLYLRIIKILP